MKLVSFLIPTRGTGLDVALKSICDTCLHAFDYEILLRIDDDDQERIDRIPELQRRYNAKCVVGPRGNGYIDMGVFVCDLVREADSQWCWLFDDDAWVEGDWYTELNKVRCDPVHGPAVNQENYILGASWYPNGPLGGAVGLIMPTEWCKTIPHHGPVDQQWLDILTRIGWTIVQLKGVNYYHDGRAR